MPGNFLIGILDGGYTNYHVRVADVPGEYDVISIFRTTFQPPSPMLIWRTCFTCPAYKETEQQFKDGISAQIARGKAVPLRVELNITDFATPSTSSSFVTLADQYIDTYKFTGLDITAYTMVLDDGDLDYTQPRTPAVVHLISAIRQIKATHPANFTLSFSFGSASLQHASDAFNYQQIGVLIPILHALRSDITMLYPNDFDDGDSILVYPNGSTIVQGMPDYWVAMVLPLLRGFVAAGKDVAAFKPEQVSLGFATTGSGPFSSRVSNFQKGVECLMLNTSCESLVAVGGPYPTLGGVAINLLNDDYFSGGVFRTAMRSVLDGVTDKSKSGNGTTAARPSDTTNSPENKEKSNMSITVRIAVLLAVVSFILLICLLFYLRARRRRRLRFASSSADVVRPYMNPASARSPPTATTKFISSQISHYPEASFHDRGDTQPEASSDVGPPPTYYSR